MFARVNTFLGSPAYFDESLAEARDRVVPAIEKLDGFQGLMVLLDQASGRSIAITFWEGEEQMRASEQPAVGMRHDATERTHEIVLSVERYEVALDTTK